MAGPTTGYQAGVEANDVTLSYAQEAVYRTLPTVPFQALRMTGETLAGSKTRQRPGEILTTQEASAATTTQEMASGNVNFALSYGTYDDFLAGAMRNDWTPAVAANGANGDITLSAGVGGSPRTLTAGSAKFSGIPVGAIIRIGGFSDNPKANGFVRVTANTGTVLTFLLSAATTAETPAGTNVQVRSSSLVNGRMFKSFHVQKRLGDGLFLRYPGSFVSGFQISGGIGNFLSGNFTLMAAQEVQASADASTGAVIAAPSGRVHDPVEGFGGVFLDGLPFNAVVDSFQFSLTASGAKQEYGMGSSAGQGQIMGLNEGKGQLKVYFRDFTLYQRFKSEKTGVFTFVTRDPDGNAYALSILAATLMNPNIQAGGPSTAVMASFDLEGNPQPGGGTFQIDRFPALTGPAASSNSASAAQMMAAV